MLLTEYFFFCGSSTSLSGLTLTVRGTREILLGISPYLFNFFDQHFVRRNAVFMLFTMRLYAQIYPRWTVKKLYARTGFIFLLSSGSGPAGEMLLAVLGENA